MDIYTNPRPLAEDVAAETADAAVKHYEVRRTPAGFLHSAWSHAEYAMNQQCSSEQAMYYFETASMLTGDIVNKGPLVGDQKVGQDIELHALVLATYLPLFARRTSGEHVTKEDCRMAYKSLGLAVQYLRPLEIDEPPQWRMVETATLALSARIGRPDVLLYPASPREESSKDESLNHDSYFFVNKEKLPIQQKLIPTQHTYDACITVLTVEPLIEKAWRIGRQEDWSESLADKVNYLLALIVAETSGESLSKCELKFLNFLTQAVAAHHTRLSGVSDMQAVA